jgi:hypothetical protein
VFIATLRQGRTEFDWNVGYALIDAPRMRSSDDLWLVGQAVRHELAPRWTLLGETYGLIPQRREGGSATLHFRGGVQFGLQDNLLVSALLGGAAGGGSPDLVASVGVTWEY